MKPAGPEQIQDTHEHDYIALGASKLKKYKHMKQAMPKIIIEIHKIMMINGTWSGFCKFYRHGRSKFRTHTSVIICLCASAN